MMCTKQARWLGWVWDDCCSALTSKIMESIAAPCRGYSVNTHPLSSADSGWWTGALLRQSSHLYFVSEFVSGLRRFPRWSCQPLPMRSLKWVVGRMRLYLWWGGVNVEATVDSPLEDQHMTIPGLPWTMALEEANGCCHFQFSGPRQSTVLARGGWTQSGFLSKSEHSVFSVTVPLHTHSHAFNLFLCTCFMSVFRALLWVQNKKNKYAPTIKESVILQRVKGKDKNFRWNPLQGM